MIPVDEARRRVLEACPPLAPRLVPVGEALGLVLAEALDAAEHVPPFANTAMDGYAVRAADTADAPVRLEVVATVAAGTDPRGVRVGPGQAVRIMTGAPIPEGADAVVMVERTSPLEDDATSVVVLTPARSGDHVRGAGEDIHAGQRVFEAGERLTPGHIGVLTSLGITQVRAVPAARVGVLSTGDELVDGPVALRPGQIRDSNRPTLLAMLAEAGCAPVDLGVAGDDEAALSAAVEDGVERCDALITTGGVSVGDYDYVKVVLERLGRMWWWQVAVKPAKPFAFGTVAGKPVFGLPGNPVSSMVSFELFARPALLRMMGHPHLTRPRVRAVADGPIPRRADGKLHLARVVVSRDERGGWHVRPSGGAGSHLLHAMARANGLALLPDGEGVDRGGSVEVMLLDLVSVGW